MVGKPKVRSQAYDILNYFERKLNRSMYFFFIFYTLVADQLIVANQIKVLICLSIFIIEYKMSEL